MSTPLTNIFNNVFFFNQNYQIHRKTMYNAGQKKCNSKLGIFCGPPEGGGSTLKTEITDFYSSQVHEKKTIKTDRFPMNFIILNLFPNMFFGKLCFSRSHLNQCQ